jgi:hypothetical protein
MELRLKINWWAGDPKYGRAGLLSFSIGESACLHLFVKPSCWQLGHKYVYEDLQSFGFGPLFLYCW